MKKIIVLISCILLIKAEAQIINAKAGKYGNFIFSGREIPKNGKEKKVYRNDEFIAKLTFPNSADEFIGKVQKFYAQNPYYPQIDDSTLINYWQWATGFSFIDSLPIAAKKPDIMAGLGILYFDELGEETKNKTCSYNFEINGSKSETVRITQPAVAPKIVIKQAGYVTDESNIISNWYFTGDLNVLVVNTYKQHVGQDQLLNKDLPIFVWKIKDTTSIRIMDTSVIKGLTYRYFVSVLDIYGFESSSLDTLKLVYIPRNSLPVIYSAKTYSDDMNKAINLTWKLQNKYAVQTIDIYRSLYFDSAYSKISTVGADDSTYSDYSIEPVTAYWYKIVINGVFERGLSTSRITGILKKGAVPISVNQLRANSVSNGIKITWINSTTDARGFYVYRGGGYKGTLELISDLILVKDKKEVYEFLDSSDIINNGYPYSYAVKVVSTGYVNSDFSDTVSAFYSSSKSLPTITDFAGQADGHQIFLSWKNRSDEFIQLAAYNLYRKENAKGEFVLLSQISSAYSEYLDTNVRIGIEYAYKLAPVSISGEEGSYATIEEKIEAPAIFAPEITKISSEGNAAKIYLEQNEQAGVNEIELYRIEQGTAAKLLAKIPANSTEYTDKTVVKNKVYFYYTVVKAYGIESGNSVPVKFELE